MKSQDERRNAWLLIIGITVGVLALSAGPALAALTFSGTSISGDGAVVIDSSSTISIGTSTATGITIGKSGSTTTFPGNITVGSCAGCGGGGGTPDGSPTQIQYNNAGAFGGVVGSAVSPGGAIYSNPTPLATP